MTATTLRIPFQHDADTQQLSLGHARKVVTTWYERAHQRQQLSKLSQEQMHDMGISYEDAMLEAAKPFWQV